MAADKAALSMRRVAGAFRPQRTNGRSAHMLAAGLVQAAIRSLPKPLQHFGRTTLLPSPTARNLNVARSLVWFTAEIA
ncbi:hypothetical protein ACPA9J_00005 [Pseudomonas aeruginosa]